MLQHKSPIKADTFAFTFSPFSLSHSLLRGILHQNQQDYMSAVECFQRAIKFRPSLAGECID